VDVFFLKQVYRPRRPTLVPFGRSHSRVYCSTPWTAAVAGDRPTIMV